MRRALFFRPRRTGPVVLEGESCSVNSAIALLSSTDCEGGGDTSKECVHVISASGTQTLAHPLEHCWSSLELLQPSASGSGVQSQSATGRSGSQVSVSK